MNSGPYDDMSKAIKFDIVQNDIDFANLFQSVPSNYELFWALEDFYDEYFNTLDATQFSVNPQTFSFGGPLITGTLSVNEINKKEDK